MMCIGGGKGSPPFRGGRATKEVDDYAAPNSKAAASNLGVVKCRRCVHSVEISIIAYRKMAWIFLNKGDLNRDARTKKGESVGGYSQGCRGTFRFCNIDRWQGYV
jgi:hypothetical protein